MTAEPTKRKSVTALIVMVLSVAALVIGNARAADQGITGKRLLLTSNPKMVLLSKDALVVPGANGTTSDPRCVADGGSGSGASVTLNDGTNSATLTMPCANWAANGAGTLYKYKDAAGTPKVAKLKAGLLKVVSPGMGGECGVFPTCGGPCPGENPECMPISFIIEFCECFSSGP